MKPSATRLHGSPSKAAWLSALALSILALGTKLQAAPLNLDLGPQGPSVHDVGAIDDGVNIVQFGNVTAGGIPVYSAMTFSVPEGLQVDRMTLTMLSFASSKGALLRVNLLTPNVGEVLSLLDESEFVGLEINDRAAVTVSFRVTPHPDFGGTVDAYWAVRIYAHADNAVPEPATGALLAAGVAGLLLTRRRHCRPDTGRFVPSGRWRARSPVRDTCLCSAPRSAVQGRGCGDSARGERVLESCMFAP